MIKFKEHDNQLFRMLEEPVPLTPDAEMPCLVRLIQDDSPMGKHNKDLHAFDPGRLTPRICAEVIDVNDLSDPNRGNARCDGFMSIQYYRYELIGTPVAKGSDEWALWRMMNGDKVRHKSYTMPNTHCAMNEKHQIAIFTTPSSMIDGGDVICHANDWLTSKQVDTMIDERTGWQIYKEPKEEPQYAKEPIANCENCKHVCTNSNIDHCHMYEPKPESENIIHGHIPADMHPEYFHLYDEFKAGDWVKYDIDSYLQVIEPSGKERTLCRTLSGVGVIVYPYTSLLTKASPSEVVVHIGCLSGTVAKSSDHAYFLMWHSSPSPARDYSIIKFTAIDTTTRELVESLLIAQEEEK